MFEVRMRSHEEARTLTLNQRVAGSIPASPTNLFDSLHIFAKAPPRLPHFG